MIEVFRECDFSDLQTLVSIVPKMAEPSTIPTGYMINVTEKRAMGT